MGDRHLCPARPPGDGAAASHRTERCPGFRAQILLKASRYRAGERPTHSCPSRRESVYPCSALGAPGKRNSGGRGGRGGPAGGTREPGGAGGGSGGARAGAHTAGRGRGRERGRPPTPPPLPLVVVLRRLLRGPGGAAPLPRRAERRRWLPTEPPPPGRGGRRRAGSHPPLSFVRGAAAAGMLQGSAPSLRRAPLPRAVRGRAPASCRPAAPLVPAGLHFLPSPPPLFAGRRPPLTGYQAAPSLLSFAPGISPQFYSLPHVTHRVKLHLRRVTHTHRRSQPGDRQAAAD